MQQHTWLPPVLRDLRAYAERHDMPATRRALEMAIEIAWMEILAADKSSKQGVVPGPDDRPVHARSLH